METDLKMHNEINSEDGLNLFWDGGLSCSAKVTVASKHLLWSFDNTVFSRQNRCTQRLFSSKYLVEEPNVDSKFPKLEKGWTFLDCQFYRRFSKVSEAYNKLTAPLRFSPEVENKYYYQPKQTNNY